MMKKKVVSMIVLLAMCFSLLPTAALAENTATYDIWVGGTQVTDINKTDVLGDGSVKYDSEENILSLNNANITTASGYSYGDGKVAGIYADCDLQLQVTGNNTVAAPTAQKVSSGIRVTGDLNIEGSGSLQAVGADITITSGSAYSYGICVDKKECICEDKTECICEVKNICIYEADVTAIGGNVTVTSGTAYSIGVYSEMDVDIDDKGYLTAKGGNAKGNTAYSLGVWTYGDKDNYLNIIIHDGLLNAIGGDVAGEHLANTAGVFVQNGGLYVYDNNAHVTIKSGNTTGSAYAYSMGVFVEHGDVGISGGTVEVTTGICKDVNVGLFVFGEKDDEGVASSGGTVNIAYDNPYMKNSPSFVATKVTIKTPENGFAIYADNGLDIEECLPIHTPENGSIKNVTGTAQGEPYSYWIIVDADGKKANTLVIDEVLTYKVSLDIPGLSFCMAPPVPKGKSLNETYALNLEELGLTEFSEWLEPYTQRDGYIFLGFYTEDGEEFDFHTSIDEDMTLAAKWSSISYGGGASNPTNTTKPETLTWSNPFNDVNDRAWYYGVIQYAMKKGLFVGVSDKEFAPLAPMSRGMLPTVLCRLEGNPVADGQLPFKDVTNNAYYRNAILWALQNNIISGVADDLFDPDGDITREQIIVMLYRYAQYKAYDTTQGGMQIREYHDYESISDYAMRAMTWAVNTGLLKGDDLNHLNPQDPATRAEVAAILQRFIEQFVEGNK